MSMSFRRHSWWKPRTRLEKVLLFLFLAFLFVTLGLSICLIFLQIKYWSDISKPSICQTKGCIETAASILSNMDVNVDPCEDFYQYSCGNFEKRVVLAEEESSINSFNSIDRYIQSRMRQIIQQPFDNKTEPKYYKLIKDLYTSCMNVSIIEELGAQPLLNDLNRAGGWPVVEGEKWNGTHFDWQITVRKFRANGIYMNFLIDVAVVQDMKNSSRFVIQIDQPSLGMPDRSYLIKGFKDPLVQAYYNYMVETAVLVGAERNYAKEEMRRALEFEIKMAEISQSKEDMRNYTNMYNNMTASQLSELTEGIDWVHYLNDIALPVKIDGNEEVIVLYPPYIANFSKLVAKTDNRIVSNYLLWRMARSLLDTLDRRFQYLRADYNRHMTGQASQGARAYYCTDTVFSNLDIAAGAMYVRNLFQAESKALATDIVEEVKLEFYNGFEDVDWLDKETLEIARQKLKAMRDYVAYPDELLDEDKINDYHQKLSITDSDYYDNIKRLNKFSTDFYLSRLRQSADQTQWINVGTAATVNAYYRFSDNTMVFYAAILNGAFFNPGRPRYMNFGSLGFIVGHEISHGFDDMGRQYDQHGNLRKWWTDETDKKFREKARCIIEQYGNYTVPEINMQVNGINTQGENIADLGGMKNAYKAYQNWVKKHGEEMPLPGLPFTSRQLFWLSNANVWCSKARKEYLALEVNTDFHAPSRFRVNGPFSNSLDFANDFNCPLGSPMNPEKKCSIW